MFSTIAVLNWMRYKALVSREQGAGNREQGRKFNVPDTSENCYIFLADAEATRSLGIRLGQSLPAGSAILLEGDLGAGKTTLVQGIGEGLGITDAIVSPTFTLINEYTEGRFPLYHLDLYRLQPSEVEALNLESYWEGVEYPLGIVAIEWAERLQYKPPDYLHLCLTYCGDHGRQVELIPVGGFNINMLSDFAH